MEIEVRRLASKDFWSGKIVIFDWLIIEKNS